MTRSLSQQFAEHDRKDAERFKAIEDQMKLLATKEDLKPFRELWDTAKNGRNGIIWVASTIIAVGGAIAVIKGLFR